jgi:hypothetical protein
LAKKISRIAALTLRYAAKPKERGKKYDTAKTTTTTTKTKQKISRKDQALCRLRWAKK